MAHFALLNKNTNIVENVIVVANEEILDENGVEQESLGIKICEKHFGDNFKYLQCSFNSKIRGKYPAIGDVYDTNIDAFMPQKPLDYFVFDENIWEWVPPNRPVETEKMILDGINYIWVFAMREWITYPIDFNSPELPEEEVDTHYYEWDSNNYLETGDVESSYVKKELPPKEFPPTEDQI